MVKLEARAGFEKIFGDVTEKLAVLEAQKAEVINKAIAEVEAQFVEQKATLEKMLSLVSVEVEELKPIELGVEPVATFPD